MTHKTTQLPQVAAVSSAQAPDPKQLLKPQSLRGTGTPRIFADVYHALHARFILASPVSVRPVSEDYYSWITCIPKLLSRSNMKPHRCWHLLLAAMFAA